MKDGEQAQKEQSDPKGRLGKGMRRAMRLLAGNGGKSLERLGQIASLSGIRMKNKGQGRIKISFKNDELIAA